MKPAPVILEKVYDAPVSTVWEALTDKDKMKHWYFELEDFKPEVGFEFQFYGGTEEKRYLHLCKVKEVITGKKISYSWRYDGFEGDSLVSFELFDENNKTRLKLTHEGLETFPAEKDPNLARENFVGGWTYFVEKGLKDYLEKDLHFIDTSFKIAAPIAKVWDVLLKPEYAKQWGNEFSEGAYVESDYKLNDLVVWYDKTGTPGTKGIVTAVAPQKHIKIEFYDDININPEDKPGQYYEDYKLYQEGGQTVFAFRAGALPKKDYEMIAPLWEKAAKKIKELAETN